MQQNILKHQHKVLGQKLLVKKVKNVKKLFVLIFLFLTNCNTISGTLEGSVRGVKRDVQTTTHYTTCIFTKVQCGDLDLKGD